MKRAILFVFFAILAVSITACQKQEISEPVPVTATIGQVEPVVVETSEPATSTPRPALSYESATYTDEMAWIALDYPQGWQVQQSVQIGERGWQGGLFSPGSSFESLAEGDSRVMITLYAWDPPGDIEAYTAQRKLAWDASGFSILEESTDFLTDDRAVVTFLVETSTGEQVVFAFLTSGDDYLEVNCEGELGLCREIIGTLRPID